MTRGLPSALPAAARLVPVAALAALCLAPPQAVAQTGAPCLPEPEVLCLLDDRFRVEVEWRDFTPNPLRLPGTPDGGQGLAVPLPQSRPDIEDGYFWFFSPDNVEVVVKMIDARQINNHFWFFAGSLTNVEYTIRVVDTQTDERREYFNPASELNVVGDTRAFGGSPTEESSALPEALRPVPFPADPADPADPAGLVAFAPLTAGTGGAPSSGFVERATLLPAGALPSCQDETVACVQDGRIAVEARRPAPVQGDPGTAAALVLETDTSALFAPVAGVDVDSGVKVLDGRAVNGEFWVFATGFSLQGLEVTVTDLETRESVTYRQEGEDPLAIGDNQPFAPDPPSDQWLETPAIPGFRFQVRVSAGDVVIPTRQEADCIPETLCVSGAIPGRSELFLRIVGPKPNGFLQPNLVKFSTSKLEVWIEQIATGQVNYYALDAAGPGSSDLTGFFDRRGFAPTD